MRVSIILPVHNQADHIRSVIRKYLHSLPADLSYELILVENGSRDESWEACLSVASENPARVRAIRREQSGWGGAVLAGLNSAAGEWLCYTNSARTRPETVLALFEAAQTSPEALTKATRTERSGIRKLASRIYNLENLILHGIRTQDVNGTPKIIRRPRYYTLSLTETGDLLDLELLAACRQKEIPILEIPVRSQDRFGGQSTTRFGSAIRMYQGSCRLWWKRKQKKSCTP